jgi:class 3 adenylate cyclase/tetratricopeptide (TPR) repeat protein
VPVCASCGHDNRQGAKFCEACGLSLAAAPARGEQRKTVTVLFCDLTGSTALGESLDPERLRALLARYFERMKSIVEHHGGSVEKFIGDAVMAVFGVPASHEDDALRALRSAMEMRDALSELGLEGRIGVTTGEVVTGTEEKLATGDAVNVAARLEQAAKPGEVLVGSPTLVLVGEAAEVESLEPLELKGKAEPVPAYRLLRLREAPERRHKARFVGRERELAILREAWERAQAHERCELVTLVGDAGVGKSRLVAEALASTDAAVVRGRCLPYGEGITYWPVVEVLKQLDLLPTDEAAAAAIRSLLGETEAATSAEEIAWAFRKTLEQAAAERPLTVVFEDIQWGEETFLDLLEHVALLSSGAAILLLCIARPELLDRRAAWPVTLRLEPLGEEDVAELIPARMSRSLREKITRAAGGNPLFVEEMLAMAGEAEGEVMVPPTLQALLAARLDMLESAERSVLERGAVEGEIFHRGAVQALAPEETQVTPRLAALVRKELIRPNKPQLAGEDGFRFRHLLIRDAAYDALPKAVRADLHERFAAWLEDRGADLVELEEILGYHLEQACRYRAELGMPKDDRLAQAARKRLAAAGRRALLRLDSAASVSLLERAVALLPGTKIDLALENDLVDALFWAGRGDEALRGAQSLAARAAAAGDRIGELCGRIKERLVRISFEPEGATDELAALCEQALPEFEDAGDDLALYIGYSGLGEVALIRARMDAMLAAYEKAFEHAQAAGMEHEIAIGRASARFFGTTPLPELLSWCDEEERRYARVPVNVKRFRAVSLAMLGRFDEARTIQAELRAELADRGGGIVLGTTLSQDSVIVELVAGDPAAGVALGEAGCRILDDLGEKGFLSTGAGNLAQALYAVGRLDEADAWAGRAADIGASDDAITQMLWRQVRAKVLARRGANEEAERLAREAVAIGEETDMVNQHADAYADLGEVLLLTGKPDEAAAALGQAVERYERKGNIVSTQRTQARLADIAEEAQESEAS